MAETTFKPLVSWFKNTYEPKLVIPGAPEKKNTLHYPVQSTLAETIFQHIRSGTFEILQGKARKSVEAKKLLPCFTPAGVFQIRHDAHLLSYSGLVSLDYDKVGDVSTYKKSAAALPYTYAIFTSPGGHGLKVFVRATGADYATLFEHVRLKYDKKLGIASDPKCRNVSRLCYVAHDPDMFFRPDPEAFTPIQRKATAPTYTSDRADGIIAFTTSKAGPYNGGNRNDYIFRLACNCNRFGIPEYETEQICRSVWECDNLDFSEAELLRTIASAKKATAHEYGKFPYISGHEKL